MSSDLVIGIFGGGQLGTDVGYGGSEQWALRSVSLDPGLDCPASQVTDRAHRGGV